MKQLPLIDTIPCDKFDLLSKEEVIELAKGYDDVIRQLQATIEETNKEILKSEHSQFLLNEIVLKITNKLFGKSTEKSEKKSSPNKHKKEPRQRVLLPSDRYPNLDVIEKRVELDKAPMCLCCNKEISKYFQMFTRLALIFDFC